MNYFWGSSAPYARKCECADANYWALIVVQAGTTYRRPCCGKPGVLGVMSPRLVFTAGSLVEMRLRQYRTRFLLRPPGALYVGLVGII